MQIVFIFNIIWLNILANILPPGYAALPAKKSGSAEATAINFGFIQLECRF